MKTPLGNFFIAGRDFAVDDHDRVEADFLNSIGSEVHSRAVLRLIGIAGRVNKEAGLGLIIPFGPAASNALLFALIKYHITFGNYLVGRVINGHLIGLQPVGADACVDVAFANRDMGPFGPGDGFLNASDR